jgi:hypothetical protein
VGGGSNTCVVTITLTVLDAVNLIAHFPPDVRQSFYVAAAPPGANALLVCHPFAPAGAKRLFAHLVKHAAVTPFGALHGYATCVCFVSD